MLFMGVQMDSLGEAFEANVAEVRLLPTMHQLVSLKLAGGGESFMTILTRVLFHKLFFQHFQLEKKDFCYLKFDW